MRVPLSEVPYLVEAAKQSRLWLLSHRKTKGARNAFPGGRFLPCILRARERGGDTKRMKKK